METTRPWARRYCCCRGLFCWVLVRVGIVSLGGLSGPLPCDLCGWCGRLSKTLIVTARRTLNCVHSVCVSDEKNYQTSVVGTPHPAKVPTGQTQGWQMTSSWLQAVWGLYFTVTGGRNGGGSHTIARGQSRVAGLRSRRDRGGAFQSNSTIQGSPAVTSRTHPGVASNFTFNSRPRLTLMSYFGGIINIHCRHSIAQSTSNP